MMVVVCWAQNSFRDLRVVVDVLLHLVRYGEERGKCFSFRERESGAGPPHIAPHGFFPEDTVCTLVNTAVPKK